MSRRLTAIVICCAAMQIEVAAAVEAASTIAAPRHHSIWQAVPLIAQARKDPLGLSPEDRKRYDEHLRAGDRRLIIGYICAALGILILIVGVALMIYRDYTKKRNSIRG
jgi:hypothetical protein